MSTTNKQDIIKVLKREIGTSGGVKAFSSNLKELNICDLSDDETLLKAAENGQLMTLLTHTQLGLIPKLIEIKKELNNE